MLALIHADIDTITQGVIPDGTILIDKGLIRAVGQHVRIPAAAQTLDLEGRRVTPGLIEAHSHAGLSEDGFPEDRDYNETTDPVTPHMLAIDGFKPTDLALAEAAQAGVTTTYMTQGSANVFCGIGAVVKTWAPTRELQVVNPQAGLKMAMGENPKRVYGTKGQRPATRMAIAAVMRETFTAARHYLDRKKAHARKVGKAKEPFAPDLKLEAVARLLSGELRARCHAHRAIDMLTFMRVAEEFGVRYVFEHATEAGDILDDLRRRQVPLVIGPTLTSRSKLEVHNRSFDTVVQAVQAGLTVAITSDHGVTPLRYLTVYAALAVRAGLSEAQALATLTINPARILALEDRLGSIERGKEADLVVWEGDPLDVRTRVHEVYVAGQPVPRTP